MPTDKNGVYHSSQEGFGGSQKPTKRYRETADGKGIELDPNRPPPEHPGALGFMDAPNRVVRDGDGRPLKDGHIDMERWSSELEAHGGPSGWWSWVCSWLEQRTWRG
jgi:hypothetical protein